MKTELPQLIYLALIFTGLLFEANLHGKTTQESHNFFIKVLCYAPAFSCLYYGGFFTK